MSFNGLMMSFICPRMFFICPRMSFICPKMFYKNQDRIKIEVELISTYDIFELYQRE